MVKVFLVGNLTRDPEQRTIPSGATLCTFGVACNRRRKTEGQPDADFFTITVWREQGERCMQYLQKGRKVAISGSLQMRTYDAQDGTKRTVLDVTADDVEFLTQNPNTLGESTPPPAKPPQASPRAVPVEAGFAEVDEDDLPF